jgi:type IX secretion system PorP/SprF family membrane protein
MIRKEQIIKWTLILVLTALSRFSYGQQDPMYTQYNFNTQTINPGYAGTWESLGFMVLGRYQWVGMDGGPRTYTFSVQSPTGNQKVAWGLDVISDKIGQEQHLSLMGDYSYRLRVGERSFLRLGLKAGVTHYSNPLTKYIQNPDETPETYENIDSKYLPNFGVGAFLYSDRYYLGLAVPKIMETDFSKSNSNYSSYSEMRHFYLQGGYVFELSHDLKFKPTFLTKATIGSPVELDLTGNFLIMDKFWLGAMYRTGDSYGFLAQWVIDKKLRLGYSVDFTTTRLQSYNNGSHELMISYEIGSRKRWSTPRMF